MHKLYERTVSVAWHEGFLPEYVLVFARFSDVSPEGLVTSRLLEHDVLAGWRGDLLHSVPEHHRVHVERHLRISKHEPMHKL